MPEPSSTLSLLVHPYARLQTVAGCADDIRTLARGGGAALVWSMVERSRSRHAETVNTRPGGVALLVILPPHVSIEDDPQVVHLVQSARAQGVLPFHANPSPADLAEVLRRPPSDLAAEVVEYIRWRGLGVDRETAQIIRRIVDLSRDLRSISAVSRSMYLSRRALGRRLMTRGLPVPSHWLQLGRLLRVILRLQNSNESVSSIAVDLGYPDGFAVSNQMARLLGYRPTEVRERLGWEWILETWLKREAESGGLRLTSTEPDPASTGAAHPTSPKRPGPAKNDARPTHGWTCRT